MKKKLSLLNLFSAIVVIAVNYLSQAIRINETTIGEISNRYYNQFTPAGYAFAIWGLIFLGLLAYGSFQVRRAYSSSEENEFIEQTGYWFILANLLNCAWVFAFTFDYTGLSVLIMLGILFSLLKIILNTNMERFTATKSVIAFVWWPIGIYSGWIAVATIANVSAYLAKLGWEGGFLTETSWTILMILIAAVLNIFMVFNRNMREFAAAGIWALAAIYMRHKDSIESIAYTALVSSIFLLLLVALHAFKTRKKNPFLSLQN